MGMGLLILLALGAGLAVGVAGVLVAWQLLHPARRTLAYALARRLPGEPAQLGWSACELRLTFPDHTQTSAWLIRGWNPQGPVFVISHGWGESRFDALPRAAPLLGLACAVLVYDLRGHGESTARICRLGAREAEDLLAILGQLEAQSDFLDGEVSFVLAGFSMGAAISIHAAAMDRCSRRIRAVVAEAPCRYTWQGVLGLLRLWKWPAWPILLAAAGVIWPWTGGAMWYDRARQARRVSCPLVVIQGSDDPICSAAGSRAIVQAAGRGYLFQWNVSSSADDGLSRDSSSRVHVSLAEADPERYLDVLCSTLGLSTTGREDNG